MDPRWKDVAESGDIDGLSSLIGEEALFADTPLHVAARAGNTQVALEIANFNPSFARKLNQSGFSPLHLAVAGGHELLASGLVEMDSELVLFRGREGKTPVHEAAITGNTSLLREFLSACPRAFEALTFKRETALHLAVKHDRLEAFKFMMKWLNENDKEHVLKWKDDEGDTILHMAAASPNYHEVIKLLVYWRLEVNAKNSKNLTALDVFDRELRRDPQTSMTRNLLLRAGALRAHDITSRTPILKKIWRSLPIVNLAEADRYFRYRRGRDSPNDVRNALLVCGTLIATTTYQSALSPPGGTWQDTFIPLRNSTTLGEEHPHYAGKSTLGRLEFLLFSFFNSFGFFFSIIMILTLTKNFPLYGVLFNSLSAMMVTFCVAILLVEPTRSKTFGFLYFSLLISFVEILPSLASMFLPPYLFLKTSLFKIFQRCRSGRNTSNSVARA